MATNLTGDCYLCGANLSKIAMKNHLLKVHGEDESGQECCLLKVEGVYSKEYWLYFDVPETNTLSDVDEFLRVIWLECCGHCSAFYQSKHIPIDNGRKLKTFDIGEKFFHEYDFGSTTETVITVAGHTRRKKQKKDVRLLARNTPPVYKCGDCGKTAEYISSQWGFEIQGPFYCAECIKNYEEGMMLPITNSPRVGVCGYGGELDVYEFNPAAFVKESKK